MPRETNLHWEATSNEGHAAHVSTSAIATVLLPLLSQSGQSVATRPPCRTFRLKKGLHGSK